MYLVISHLLLIACHANGSVISMSRHAIEVEQISKHMFENIPNDFGESATDFREEKMTLAMFHCDLKLILAKRKLLRRCFMAI